MIDVVLLLAPYRDAGVLSPADVHTAASLARLAHIDSADVVLAVALAARAPRFGHVCVDLHTVADTVAAETETDTESIESVRRLHWPQPDGWLDAVSTSTLVSAANAPLVVDGSRLYLERYHRYEHDVALHLQRRSATPVSTITPSPEVLDSLLTGEGSQQQRVAVDAALSRDLTVLVGGPGTGKTTTVASLLATLVRADAELRIALAAPTGKAAARLGEAFRQAAQHLPDHLAPLLASAETSTIHRLLGVQWNSRTRFRHDRHRPLPHDVVIIDETSMVSLPLMAKLLDAVRPDARLVLVGDPGQLASVEAGSVLADVAGPVAEGQSAVGPLGGCVSALQYSRRFPPGSPLDRLARAVRAGDAAQALAVLRDPAGEVAGRGALRWLALSGADTEAASEIRGLAVPAAMQVHRHAVSGDAAAALTSVESLRVLCAHRKGTFGVERWNARIEGWLATEGMAVRGWYVGRPVLVTANDYRNNLYNGDLGVVVVEGSRSLVAFAGVEGVRLFGSAQLESVETVHAMTIHKSQGSEFDHVVVVLPPADSPLATRELLYTAITRARRQVTVVGDQASIEAAINRQVTRSSGLRDLLWPSS